MTTETHKDLRVLITIDGPDVAPRFDLTTEVLLGRLETGQAFGEEKTVVLPHPSAEDLCHMILSEQIDVVICGGIEEEFYQYLTWKKVEVIDSIMGPWATAVIRLREGDLKMGTVLFDRLIE